MYHVRANGEYGKCSAKKGKCPFANEEGIVFVGTKREAEALVYDVLPQKYNSFQNLTKQDAIESDRKTEERLLSTPGLIHTTRQYRKSPNTNRGYAHEYQLANFIAKLSDGKAWVDETNKTTLNTRKNYYNSIRQSNPKEADEIMEWASNSAKTLPKAVGPISFTASAVNKSEVYDVQYKDENGNVVKLSAKLAEAEDKAYRFNTRDSAIPSSATILQKAYKNATTGKESHEEALARNGYTVASLQEEMVAELSQSLKSKKNDYETLMRLTKDSFIGHGGYFKTLPKGHLRYYPSVEKSDTIEIKEGSVRTSGASVFYTISILDKDKKVKQDYQIQFRVKYKDGKQKPVKINKDGMPDNIAATVSLKLL